MAERQLNDPYVARAKREGFRSRAAFKLLEIDDKYHLLKARRAVVDLGAAPGGWSADRGANASAPRRAGGQRGRHRPSRHASRFPASTFLQLDFLDAARRSSSRRCSAAPADVVLSDMAANATGHRKTDHLRIMALAEARRPSRATCWRPAARSCARCSRAARPATACPAQARLCHRAPRQAAGEPRGFRGALSAGDGFSRRALRS